MVEETLVRSRLEAALSPMFLEVSDFSDGCGAKYNVIVVSDAFADKKLIERHRMVNEALKAEMPAIHALTMKTYTPQQWAQFQK